LTFIIRVHSRYWVRYLCFFTPAEDDGYILTLLFNGREESSELLVFNAKDIAGGPTHRIPIPVNIPFGFHGSYANGLVFDAEDVVRKWKVIEGDPPKLDMCCHFNSGSDKLNCTLATVYYNVFVRAIFPAIRVTCDVPLSPRQTRPSSLRAGMW